MNEVKILVQGYAQPGKNDSYIASPSCTLIESKSKKVVVDPGANSKKLLNALNKEGLKPSDIDIVYVSHYHPDHTLCLRLFPNHDIYDGETLWREDREFFHSDNIPGTEIEILPTPGHAPEHTSLLVETEDKGTVCIAADVFWWEDGKQKSDTVNDLMNLKDPFVLDMKALKKSRKLVLEKADWIIPGHGKMFKTPSKQ